MTRYYIGMTVRVRASFRDVDDVLSDPSAITLVMKTPVGTFTYTYADAEITREDTGIYYRDVLLTAGYKWEYHWESTGNPSTAIQGSLFVEPSNVD